MKKSNLTLKLLVLVLLMGSAAKAQTEVIYHKPKNPKRASAPFSEVVQVGNTFYLSGQIGMDRSKGRLAEGGIKAETEQAIKNIKGVLNIII